MNNDFVWEDPPERGTYNPPWEVGADTYVDETLAKLQTQPGRWARVFIGGGYATNNRKSLLDEAGCETRTVRTQTGSNIRRLYARWIG